MCLKESKRQMWEDLFNKRLTQSSMKDMAEQFNAEMQLNAMMLYSHELMEWSKEAIEDVTSLKKLVFRINTDSVYYRLQDKGNVISYDDLPDEFVGGYTLLPQIIMRLKFSDVVSPKLGDDKDIWTVIFYHKRYTEDREKFLEDLFEEEIHK